MALRRAGNGGVDVSDLGLGVQGFRGLGVYGFRVCLCS